MKEMADSIVGKIAKVYYFDRKTGSARDISGLDRSDDASEAGWGGLSEFSGHVADIVARVVNNQG